MTQTRRHLLAGFAAAALTPSARAAEAPSDAAIVEAAFRALHPGLLRYNTPAELDRRFGRLRRDMAAARTPPAQWLALTSFTAALRCGHTFVNGANQEGAALAFFEGRRDRLPFAWRWLGGGMVVTDPGPAEGLRPGDTVVRIGPRRTADLLAPLMALAAADGASDGKRRRLSEVNRRELWPLPDVALPILAPEAFGGETVALAVRGADGRVRAAQAPLLTRAERVALRGSDAIAPRDGPAWRVDVQPDRTRLITMPTWAVYNSRWDWAGWLNAQADLAIDTGAPGIVLDLRGNAGGTECGDPLLSRLVDREIVRADALRYVRYRSTPPELDRYLTTWDRSFRDWGDAARGPDARGFYRLTRWDEDARGTVIRPRGRRFGGRLAVLIDGACSSATFQFAQTVQRHGLGVLVGEPTGGNRRGINGGAFFFLRLPQSGFALDLPLVATFPTTPQPDAGILPDVAATPTPGDLVAGRDRQLEAALAAVRGR